MIFSITIVHNIFNFNNLIQFKITKTSKFMSSKRRKIFLVINYTILKLYESYLKMHREQFKLGQHCLKATDATISFNNKISK